MALAVASVPTLLRFGLNSLQQSFEDIGMECLEKVGPLLIGGVIHIEGEGFRAPESGLFNGLPQAGEPS
jgi:hypothetical protein